jgi:hypothetical protein
LAIRGNRNHDYDFIELGCGRIGYDVLLKEDQS